MILTLWFGQELNSVAATVAVAAMACLMNAYFSRHADGDGEGGCGAIRGRVLQIDEIFASAQWVQSV